MSQQPPRGQRPQQPPQYPQPPYQGQPPQQGYQPPRPGYSSYQTNSQGYFGAPPPPASQGVVWWQWVLIGIGGLLVVGVVVNLVLSNNNPSQSQPTVVASLPTATVASTPTPRPVTPTLRPTAVPVQVAGTPTIDPKIANQQVDDQYNTAVAIADATNTAISASNGNRGQVAPVQSNGAQVPGQQPPAATPLVGGSSSQGQSQGGALITPYTGASAISAPAAFNSQTFQSSFLQGVGSGGTVGNFQLSYYVTSDPADNVFNYYDGAIKGIGYTGTVSRNIPSFSAGKATIPAKVSVYTQMGTGTANFYEVVVVGPFDAASAQSTGIIQAGQSLIIVANGNVPIH